MLDQQEQLAVRYASLRDTRSGPVFFIEHGLAETEIADLVTDVRAAADVYPLDSGWWDAHKLPLIVAATEVGYSYRGTGTDFWPVLDENLGVQFGGGARQRVRDLFESAAKTFRGAHPPATPWAEAFHLIAWPITHALIPLELHRPLALTLANLRDNVAALDDDALYRAIRVAAAGSSARFATLLETPDLVVSVARSLLSAASTEFCPEAMQRIADDLAGDHLARKCIAVARRVQRAVKPGTPTKRPTRRDVPAIQGLLQLRRRDDAFTLEASFPTVEPQLSTRLRRALRRRRFAPRLWGVTAQVPSEQLLSGLPFALRLASAPAEDAPLLPGLEELDVDADLLETLGAFELRLAPNLAFAIASNGEIARAIRGADISGHRHYWVLAREPVASLATLPKLREIGPYTCHALDPADAAAARALEDLGYRIRFGISVSFVGTPPLDHDASTDSFVVGDQRLVAPRRSHPDGIRVEFDDASERVTDELVRVMVPPGERLLRISSGGEVREFRFRGVPTPTEPPLAGCSIELRSPEPTVQALLNGSLSFTIDGFAPLEGLDFTLELEVAGRRFGTTVPLGPLPQTLASDSEPWTILLDDATRELLLQALSPTVHLRVGCLAARSWVLEQRVRPCWWVRGPDDGVALRCELGDLEYGEVAVIEPHLPPTRVSSLPEREARLLAPIGLDTATYGPAAHFTTLCLAPSRTRLEAPAVGKPRLQRRRRGEHRAAGLEDLLEAYLRWSLAESEKLIAEMRRRQTVAELDAWIADLCCGDEWARREAKLSGADPWERLIELCNEIGLGLDSYVELSQDDEREIVRLAVSNIRAALPYLWTLIGPPSELGDADYDALDDACIAAYDTLSDLYRRQGQTELATKIREGDPSADTDRGLWDKVLGRVNTDVELHRLAELLLPTDTAQGLIALDAQTMSLDELTEELAHWGKRARRALAGGAPSAETLKASMALWIEPETAVKLDWRGALGTLIAERPLARAARYLALKSRRARRGGAT